MQKRLAFLVSNASSGTNLQAVIDAIAQKKIIAEMSVVVSDAPDAYGLVRAKNNAIPIHILQEGEDLEKLLVERSIDYICLGGWKKMIPESFIERFKDRILNIHPGLIPDTIDGVVKNPDGTDALWNKNKFTNNAVKNFLDNKATYAGSTVHFLSHVVDFGRVLARGFVKIEEGDTVESLYDRLKKKEHEIYIEALQKLCN
jgi:phosphoribosylglycinamide formyltransferase-1